jgi:nucleotide-binding universal stress UspA family protein
VIASAVESNEGTPVGVAFASDCSAYLIVVGALNGSWLEALLNPPIARDITKSAPCPVLVVPESV